MALVTSKALVRAGKPKRHRSCQTPLDCSRLCDDFVPLAQTRLVAWRWDGQFYSKSTRSLGPNREELALASPVLRILFEHNPNGYPNHRDLRTVLGTLDKKYKLMECLHKDEVKCNESPFEVYNEAAKLWRMMTRHCLDLFKGNQMHTVADTDLRKVIRLAKPEVMQVQVQSGGDVATTSTTIAIRANHNNEAIGIVVPASLGGRGGSDDRTPHLENFFYSLLCACAR